MEFRTATELVAALRSRQVSSVELTEAAIAAIEAGDGVLNAVVVRDFDRARAAAKAADAALAKGSEKRALLGLPITVKESFNVAGLPTTWGIPNTQKIPVTQDAVTVARLKDAGAVVLGKTNVSYLLADWQSFNDVYGTSNNPWSAGHTPGGSSGGSAAALAAGFVSLELGSDLAGSLRVPAHFCGIYAHKPSSDIIPRRGQNPPGVPALSLAPRLDLAVCGPMARSAQDLMLGLDVLAGPDDYEAAAWQLKLPAPRHAALKDYRVLVIDRHPLTPTDASVRDPLNDLAERLAAAGCRVGRSSEALPDLALIGRMYLQALMAFIGSNMPQPDYETAVARAAALPEGADDLRSLTQRSLVTSHRGWVQADFIRTGIADGWRRFFRDWDILLCPVMPTPALAHDHRPVAERTVMIDGRAVPYGELPLWSSIATLTGLPSTAFPVGISAQGLPVGAQAIGPFLEDRTTITFADLVAQAFGGFKPPPAG
ncbi:amidase [Ferrovibrio sp.]|uniref:amidase n=1 Tax=Ferrovibrio sp. TaxID=1917215 RepID=UPI000CC05837|nr:amidase [Ferrovibrio sp.]PJI39009.1 MAG: amidase [Ferrovibrio sp.]